MTAHFPGLRQVGGFPISSANKTDRHDISEIVLKVELNTIKHTNNLSWLGINTDKKMAVLGCLYGANHPFSVK